MGYTYVNPEVRIIESGKVYKPHMPDELYCDPCSWPAKRYTLRYKRQEATPDGGVKHLWFEVTYAWWEIIEPWDNARDRYIKWKQNKEVMAAHEAVWNAEKELYRLTGPRYPA